MRYIAIALIFLLSTSIHAAEFIPKKLSQMTDDLGVGTHTADTSNPHGTTTTQTNLTVGSLTVSGSINLGTVTLSGYIKDNGGSATSTRLTSVQINSGTATLSGVASPYIAQTNGTGSGITLAGITDLGTTSINVSGTPLIDLAIGDTDTGIKWNSDGNIDLYINNAYVINLTPSVAKITDTLYIEGGNAQIKIGTTTQDGSAKITSNGLVSVKSGGVKYPDGNIQTEAITQLVKGIVAGSGISIDNPTGTVTITASGSTGGWTDGTNTVYVTVAADQVIIGSTTAAANQILTVVGSQTTTDLNVKNAMSLAFTGTPTIDLAIGDNDTGLEQSADNVLAMVAGGASTLVLDGTTNRVRIGTSTLNTTLQVGGTVTAGGFGGNGAGLTGITVAFSAVTGSATSNQLPISPTFAGTQSTFGTTTQANNSVLTISGSGSSPLSIVGNSLLGNLGTGTTNTMTGTTTSGHTVTPSSQNGAYAGYLAFDKVLDEPQRWIAQTQVATLTYDFGTGTTKVIGRYDLAVENSSTDAPTAWEFAGSNDNINYVGIHYKTGYTWDNPSNPDRTFNAFTIATSTTAYQFYRLKILTMQSANNATIEEMRLIQDNLKTGTILYINGTNTVLVGTATANSTATVYLLQVAGSALATSWGVTCYGAIKSIIDSGSATIKQGYNAVMRTKLFTHHPKTRNIKNSEAEHEAKVDYVRSFYNADYGTFKNANIAAYRSGTGTVNWNKLREDFETQYVEPRYDEFYVLSDMNKRINDKKVDLESDTSITNISPVSDDPSTPEIFKRGDPKILDLENQIGALIGTVQYQATEIRDLKNRMGIP